MQNSAQNVLEYPGKASAFEKKAGFANNAFDRAVSYIHPNLVSSQSYAENQNVDSEKEDSLDLNYNTPEDFIKAMVQSISYLMDTGQFLRAAELMETLSTEDLFEVAYLLGQDDYLSNVAEFMYAFEQAEISAKIAPLFGNTDDYAQGSPAGSAIAGEVAKLEAGGEEEDPMAVAMLKMHAQLLAKEAEKNEASKKEAPVPSPPQMDLSRKRELFTKQGFVPKPSFG